VEREAGSLLFALALAHFFLVGLFALMQASFFPPVLRVAHSLEVAADSFAYATIPVLLLTAPGGRLSAGSFACANVSIVVRQYYRYA
jgi:hypothetical protein